MIIMVFARVTRIIMDAPQRVLWSVGVCECYEAL